MGIVVDIGEDGDDVIVVVGVVVGDNCCCTVFEIIELFELLWCDELELSLNAVSSPLRSGGGVAYTDAAITSWKKKQNSPLLYVCQIFIVNLCG